MAQLTINIPDAQVTRVREAFALAYNYVPLMNDGIPNPETKAAHALRRIREFIRETVASQEGEMAANAARTTASDAARTITIT